MFCRLKCALRTDQKPGLVSFVTLELLFIDSDGKFKLLLTDAEFYTKNMIKKEITFKLRFLRTSMFRVNFLVQLKV